ncbi:hypothetical protein F4703DRAFT_1866350 [Phycomyces blakesleeanus]
MPALYMLFKTRLYHHYQMSTIGNYRNIITIIQKCPEDIFDEEDVKIELLQCARTYKRNRKEAINAIVALTTYLYDWTISTPSEAYLTTSHIHPFVHNLLSFTRQGTGTITLTRMVKLSHSLICYQYLL